MLEMVYKEIEKDVLNRTFIKKYNLNRQQLWRCISSESFKSNLEAILTQEDYHCNTVFELVMPYIHELNIQKTKSEWLHYFYDYALSYSFPDAVTRYLTAPENAVGEVFLKILQILSNHQRHSSDSTWQSQYPLIGLTASEIEELEDASEYTRFINHFSHEYVYEMMKLNQEVIGYTTLDHICGVYHLAMKVARQMRQLGYPIDLGRVAGAAAGHDIGKFGCKPDEMSRVAYYHYHYTGEWFEKRNIVYIRNVAINHSTWDLELEALSIESLVLIYSDFRVKAEWINGKSTMCFFTLKDSFDVILQKLDDVDTQKELRYKRVYAKLDDFEKFLWDHKINTDPDVHADLPLKQRRKYNSLMQGDEVTANVIFSSIRHNIELMYRLRDEASLNKLLETVRSSRDMTVLRSYISILEEYYNYLTQKQKQIMISFLYEKLVLPEEDIRKQAAELIGTIIASYDEENRKETPKSALQFEKVSDSLSLFEYYMLKFIKPDNKIIDRHKKFISYSMRDMIASYFKHAKIGPKRQQSITLIIHFFEMYKKDELIQFYLIKSARVLPFSDFDKTQTLTVLQFVSELLTARDLKLRLRAYNLIYSILPFTDDDLIQKTQVLRVLKTDGQPCDEPAENYAKLKLAEHLKCSSNIIDTHKKICLSDLESTSNIFLSNLKSATIDVVKKFQIELLMRNTLLYDYENCFYMAMHLCNILKVSARESVRNMAGRLLVQMVTHLSFEQKNDIAVELIRSLEMESYEVTKYIPPYLGEIILQVKPIELDEILDSFESKMSTNNENLIVLTHKTIGFAISRYSNYRFAFKDQSNVHENRILKMYGLLFSGFVHSSSHVNLNAFNVISKDIFQCEKISLRKREYLYKATIKKIMSLMVNTDEGNELIFFNNSASLKHIYSFIADYRHQHGQIIIEGKKKIAFFPGAFDPFTLGHKQIACDIRDKGFEIMLYVDEFSWSKRTQPNLIRRNIIKKSIACEIDIYQIPRDISINIANDNDLKKMIDLFPHSEVFLVAGSDVILNASAYKNNNGSLIHSVPHLIYERDMKQLHREDELKLQNIVASLHPDTFRLALPKAYEHISSSLIRDYIDENRDISSMIDPMAQNYIYEKNLYQREPLYKSIMSTKSISLHLLESLNEEIINEAKSLIVGNEETVLEKLKVLSEQDGFKMLILRNLNECGSILAIAVFHWLRATDIHHAFSDDTLIQYVRNHSVGRILVIDGIFKRKNLEIKNIEQIMLTETLAYALSRDYTYGLYKESFRTHTPKEMIEVLGLQGFQNISSVKSPETVYVVNMTSPSTLNLDIHSMFKEPYKSSPELIQVMNKARIRLQKAISELYPGNLVLSFDRSMIYENLIKKVCDENGVSAYPSEKRQLGPAMCVPFGAVFKRWILPNTVTKTLHAEKYFSTDLTTHEIKEYPLYLDIENQIKMLKSFNRPIILVDDLLNKGYRIKALEPYFRSQDLKVQKLIVGIMSGSGKEIAEKMNINVDAGYFIPRIKVWFYESKLYPFIDGDAIWRGSIPDSNLIPSVNMILPYSSASYIVGAKKAAIYNLSEVAILNAIEILSSVENAYEGINDRLLTIKRLGEVINTPRFPDKGKHIFYSDSVKPSEYLKDDLEQLRKLKSLYME